MPQAADLRGVLNEKRAASTADKGAPAPTSDVPTAAVKGGHRRSPHKSVNFSYGSKRSAAAVGLAAPGAHGVDTLSQVDAGIVLHDLSSDGIVRLHCSRTGRDERRALPVMRSLAGRRAAGPPRGAAAVGT